LTGAPPIKKTAKYLDELDFLTPNKASLRATGTPSSANATTAAAASRTPGGPSAHRDLGAQQTPTSPFSPAAKPLVASSSATNNELTPSVAAGTRLLKPSELRITFLNRLERFKVVESLNLHLPSSSANAESSKPRALPLKFEFSKHKNPEKFHFRYMYEKLSDRSDVLDRQLEEGGMVLGDWYEIEEWGDPSVISQEDIWAYGRICAESQEAKLSEQACWLETSRMLGHGRRVRLQWTTDLKVHGVGPMEQGIGLFPGAIVGLRGRNGGGTYFNVQEILSMPMAEPATTPPKTLLSYLPNPPAPISLVVACGPFTWDTDLDFLPFESFIDHLMQLRPDCVILLGPFIDAHHPLIKTGNISHMPSAIFREKISSRLHKLVASSPRTHVILIPSPRDVLVSQVVYPQAALNMKDPELGLFGRNVLCLPNPALFTINETLLGINNVDVLMPLKKEELFLPANVVRLSDDEVPEDDPNATNVISRACRHVMRQRSFYPLFPPAIGTGFDAINLDVTHLELLQHDTVVPDILILPTNFTAFAKVIDSNVVVNPRQLCKSRGTGTFAQLTIHDFNRQSIEQAIAQTSDHDDEELDHLLAERCRVDIVKL